MVFQSYYSSIQTYNYIFSYQGEWYISILLQFDSNPDSTMQFGDWFTAISILLQFDSNKVMPPKLMSWLLISILLQFDSNCLMKRARQSLSINFNPTIVRFKRIGTYIVFLSCRISILLQFDSNWSSTPPKAFSVAYFNPTIVRFKRFIQHSNNTK